MTGKRKLWVGCWIFRLTGGPGGPWKPTGPPSPITPLEPTRPFLPDSPAGPRFPLLPCCPGTPASPAWKTNKYKHTHKQASALLHCVHISQWYLDSTPGKKYEMEIKQYTHVAITWFFAIQLDFCCCCDSGQIKPIAANAYKKAPRW